MQDVAAHYVSSRLSRCRSRSPRRWRSQAAVALAGVLRQLMRIVIIIYPRRDRMAPATPGLIIASGWSAVNVEATP